jgi:hypothetical protein
LKRKFIGEDDNWQIPLVSQLKNFAMPPVNVQLEVSELDISARYSLNKMFVTTTVNYASNWENVSISEKLSG